MNDNGKLEQFQNREYIRLETFVKRMRNSSQVRVAPSDAMGKPHGVTVAGTALRVNADMEIKISQLLYRKYGLMKMSFDLWGAIKQLDWAVFAIKI